MASRILCGVLTYFCIGVGTNCVILEFHTHTLLGDLRKNHLHRVQTSSKGPHNFSIEWEGSLPISRFWPKLRHLIEETSAGPSHVVCHSKWHSIVRLGFARKGSCWNCDGIYHGRRHALAEGDEREVERVRSMSRHTTMFYLQVWPMDTRRRIERSARHRPRPFMEAGWKGNPSCGYLVGRSRKKAVLRVGMDGISSTRAMVWLPLSWPRSKYDCFGNKEQRTIERDWNRLDRAHKWGDRLHLRTASFVGVESNEGECTRAERVQT